jgi:hypothetical protein
MTGTGPVNRPKQACAAPVFPFHQEAGHRLRARVSGLPGVKHPMQKLQNSRQELSWLLLLN